MGNIKPLQLEDVLSPGEISEFHQEWQDFKGKNTVADPYEVHNGLPVISKVFQFKDKPIFKARVFQGRNRLRKINPYHNAPFYLMPFWHIDHFWRVGEQMYHASMEKHRPNNQEYIIRDLPKLFDIKDSVYWPSKVQGHVSMTAIHKVKVGSWERGKAMELFTGHYQDDKTDTYYGSMTGVCFLALRSYVRCLRDIEADVPGSKEKMIRVIENQGVSHKYMLAPRTNLTTSSEELIAMVQNGGISDTGKLADFFSLYDRPTTEAISV